MNKTLRTFILLALVTLMCMSIAIVVSAEANIPSATSDFYVNDFAGVFTEDEKAALMTNAVSLANEHNGIQVVVTTVKSLEGDTVENYAYRMYNQYGIGKDDMGLLILLATEDRQIRVEVGRAMEGYINDSKAGRFMDKYAIPYLKENKFNEGLISLQQAFITEIKSCVTSEQTTENTPSIEINIDWGAVLFTILIVAASGGIIWLVIFIVNKTRKKKQEKDEYIQGLKDEISSLNNKIERLNSEIDSKQYTIDTLKLEKRQMHDEIKAKQDEINAQVKSLESFKSRHKRILAIYPDADKRVDEMIEAEKVARDKAAADKVDELIASVINLQPDKDLVDRLESIQRKIDSLNSDEAKYLQSDMTRFNILCSKCNKLKREYEQKVEEERRRRLTEQRKEKATDITRQLLGIVAAIGIVRSSHISRLRDAKALYENLDTETRSYVDASAISKIEEMLRRAKRIKEDEEEAERRRRREEEERRRREEDERRRRQASSYSTSSYRPGSSSHGSFGGFGGRSGGGGASRGF